MTTKKIAVIGLGYVGLPLAVEFGKIRPVLGFDISSERIKELKGGHDRTLEVDGEELAEASHLSFSSNPVDLKSCDIFLVTVPTPVNEGKTPDLSALKGATKMIGGAIKKGALVIYESTVFPGCTRDECVPILEEVSGLVFNKDFHVGYSPERANPGDKEHRLTTIMKVTSGSTPEIADEVDALYASIVTAGTHKAQTIEVAEAAKVIENTQRDLNIALINELAVIFNRLGIDTLDVLEAAGTKWNFLPFRPGLVGGHCIGVDPYYLTYKAQKEGYHPDVILAGRRVNDGMAVFIADQVARLMMMRSIPVVGSRILVLGLSFKENCPDIRNSKVIDVITQLKSYNATVDVYDPWVDHDEVRHEFGIECLDALPEAALYDAAIVAVSHKEFVEMGAGRLRGLCKEPSVLYDIKGILPRDSVDARL